MFRFQELVILAIISTCGKSAGGPFNDEKEKFEFTRIEPGNELGITVKVIAHIHRAAKQTTETWRFNKEFTPTEILSTLKSACSERLIENKLKWSNCNLDRDGLTAQLTHGTPQSKNKTLTYLEMRYKPFKGLANGKTKICKLSVIIENPSYFMIETYSKLPSNDSFTIFPQDSAQTFHQHQLGKFSQEFLNVYKNSIDPNGIYSFDRIDYDERSRDQIYNCLLSIGSSESASVIEEKCPIYCVDKTDLYDLRASTDDEDILQVVDDDIDGVAHDEL